MRNQPIVVLVVTPAEPGGGFGLELDCSFSLPPDMEDELWDRTKKALLEALEACGGLPEGGLLVTVSLELSSGWEWKPSHTKVLPKSVASIAASGLKAILSASSLGGA